MGLFDLSPFLRLPPRPQHCQARPGGRDRPQLGASRTRRRARIPLGRAGTAHPREALSLRQATPPQPPGPPSTSPCVAAGSLRLPDLLHETIASPQTSSQQELMPLKSSRSCAPPPPPLAQRKCPLVCKELLGGFEQRVPGTPVPPAPSQAGSPTPGQSRVSEAAQTQRPLLGFAQERECFPAGS